MNVRRNWLLCGVLLVTALASGCVRHKYFAMQGGYGYRMAINELPDAGSRVKYTYTQNGRMDRTVWPWLPSGCYRASVIQGDLILFVTRDPWPAFSQQPGKTRILAAKGGPPVVDITRTILQSAGQDTGKGFQESLAFSALAQTNSRVYIHWDRWIENRRQPIEVVLTGQEIGELVARLRTESKAHRYKGITYYADE